MIAFKKLSLLKRFRRAQNARERMRMRTAVPAAAEPPMMAARLSVVGELSVAGIVLGNEVWVCVT